MNLTSRQQSVIDALEKVCRRNIMQYREISPYLYQQDLLRVAAGDAKCVFGGGGLTYQVGKSLGIKASAVLATFKALEAKGLVLRETKNPSYQRPLYWWPVGLAEKLNQELAQQQERDQ